MITRARTREEGRYPSARGCSITAKKFLLLTLLIVQDIADKAVSKAISLSMRGRIINERFENVLQVMEALRSVSDTRKQELLDAVSPPVATASI